MAKTPHYIIKKLVSSMTKQEKLALLQCADSKILDYLISQIMSKILKGKL